MSRYEQLLQKILSGRSDANIRFDELCALFERFGFVERVRRSHHIFRKMGVPERITLQRDANHAKPYQVRRVILKHKLEAAG